MRSGLTNTAACKVLGVHRRAGVLIRKRHRHQTAQQAQKNGWSGRYLSLPERLQIADLLRLGCSLRAIAAELGRSPRTSSASSTGTATPKAATCPRRPITPPGWRAAAPARTTLVANDRLRRVVQRKPNRCWSPDEISGWLRRSQPTDRSMWLCPETIYRALLVPGGQGLHKRYCRKPRTGRRIRKSR